MWLLGNYIPQVNKLFQHLDIPNTNPVSRSLLNQNIHLKQITTHTKHLIIIYEFVLHCWQKDSVIIRQEKEILHYS